jgi:archaellum component FlaC
MDRRDLDIMDIRLVKKEWVEEHPVDAIVQIVKNMRKDHRVITDIAGNVDEHFKSIAEFSNGLGTSLNEQGDIVDEHAGQIETLEKQLKALTKTLLEQSKQIKKLQGSRPSSKSKSKSRSK